MTTAKHAGGRPTAYRPEYAELGFNYAVLGAIDEQLAEFFHVTRKTIDTWKKTYPAFADALQRGKVIADAEIARSLYHRAKGYSHPETLVHCYQGEILKTDVTKHYPPDTTACIFWLKNRQPSLWRDRVEQRQEVIIVSPDRLDEIYRKGMEKQREYFLIEQERREKYGD
jgi:hypothetical protein